MNNVTKNGLKNIKFCEHSFYQKTQNVVREEKMLKKGIYQHYQGNLYQVLGIARHSESLEEMVVYQALYPDYGLWVRPRALFEERVTYQEKTCPRFRFIQSIGEEPPQLREEKADAINP